jgi:hypothetical protein
MTTTGRGSSNWTNKHILFWSLGTSINPGFFSQGGEKDEDKAASIIGSATLYARYLGNG